MAASDKDEEKARKKQPETVRDRAEKAIAEASKPKKKSEKPEKSESVAKPKKPSKTKKLKFIKRKQKDSKPKEDKKPRRFHIIPKFIREAFKEIKLVTWPDARTTFKLTTAVIIFATVFSVMVSLVDYGFGKIFKKVFLNG